MKKAIMLSIQPKWANKILEGKKTIEVRRTEPRCELPVTVYIYYTKARKHPNYGTQGIFNGKVVAKFTLDSIAYCFNHASNTPFPPYDALNCQTVQAQNAEFLKQSCMTKKQVHDYIRQDRIGYSWHISDLQVFDRPKDICEFWKKRKCTSCHDSGYEVSACSYDEECMRPMQIERAPQDWFYIEEAK